MKYFDEENKRIIYIKNQATPDFWDEQWSGDDLKSDVERNGKNDDFVRLFTKKYIKADKSSKILEGGCGKGHFVYSLNEAGFDSYGIDFAPQIIKKLKLLFPDLHYELGDVRKLEFADDYFDGYWSLGVIEHFYDGYDDIASEMKRVLKSGGYLFITFPQMSILRKVKAGLGLYKKFETEINKENFYQFALDSKKVSRHFIDNGFTLIENKALDGANGLRDEMGASAFMNKLYGDQGLNFKIMRKLINICFSWFSGHVTLLVLRKK